MRIHYLISNTNIPKYKDHCLHLQMRYRENSANELVNVVWLLAVAIWTCHDNSMQSQTLASRPVSLRHLEFFQSIKFSRGLAKLRCNFLDKKGHNSYSVTCEAKFFSCVKTRNRSKIGVKTLFVVVKSLFVYVNFWKMFFNREFMMWTLYFSCYIT